MNNPIRYTDVFGMGAGDFYDEDLNKIGTDGVDDGKVYVVTDKQERKAIAATDKAGGVTTATSVTNKIELPDKTVRTAMGEAVKASDAPNTHPTAPDTKGGFHEEGGMWGTDANGNTVVDKAPTGPATQPVPGGNAEINVTGGYSGKIENYEGTYHVHPSGSTSESSTTNLNETGAVSSFGGTTTTNSFVQTPSSIDIANVPGKESVYGMQGNHYVLGAGSGKVYMYNSGGTVTNTKGNTVALPLKKFVNLP